MGFFGYVKNQSRTQVPPYRFKIIIGAYNEGQPKIVGCWPANIKLVTFARNSNLVGVSRVQCTEGLSY